MDLEAYIKSAFPQGLTYKEAALLCLRLCGTVNGVPEHLQGDCSKERLAEIFAALAADNYLTGEPLTTEDIAASSHPVMEKGYWMGIIASLMKQNAPVHGDRLG